MARLLVVLDETFEWRAPRLRAPGPYAAAHADLSAAKRGGSPGEVLRLDGPMVSRGLDDRDPSTANLTTEKIAAGRAAGRAGEVVNGRMLFLPRDDASSRSSAKAETQNIRPPIRTRRQHNQADSAARLQNAAQDVLRNRIFSPLF